MDSAGIDSKPIDDVLGIQAYVTDRATGETVTKELITMDPSGKYIFTPDIYACDPLPALPSVYEAIKKLQNYIITFDTKEREFSKVLRTMRGHYTKGLLSLDEYEETKNTVNNNSKWLKASRKRCKELIRILKDVRSILRQRCAEE